MLKRTIAGWIFLTAVSFGQSKMPTGPGSSPAPPGSAGSANGSRDSGADHPLELKSIDQILRENPRLVANLKAMLPSDVAPQQACSGFKTLEQCVVTVHAAQNLKLSFSDLKTKTTGKGSLNLQKVIEEMSTGINAKAEIKKAKKQAAEDMKGLTLFGDWLAPNHIYAPNLGELVVLQWRVIGLSGSAS